MSDVMDRPVILLTNDDSHDSPLFLRAIAALATLGEVHIVVPATEQSWKGKAMTRHGPLYAERIDLHGWAAWSVTGTPADCVNLGIHELLPARPAMVVSGINIGKNVGLGFLFSSGTVGACLEANIAGLPALALSQELSPEDFRYWDEHRAFQPALNASIERSVASLVPRVWQALIAPGHDQPTTWNVNFPAPTTQSTEPQLVRARLGHSWYRGCFRRVGDRYHHALSTAEIDPAPDTDDAVLQAGQVSITLIDMRVLGQRL
jgi:5'-nucleotidase